MKAVNVELTSLEMWKKSIIILSLFFPLLLGKEAGSFCTAQAESVDRLTALLVPRQSLPGYWKYPAYLCRRVDTARAGPPLAALHLEIFARRHARLKRAILRRTVPRLEIRLPSDSSL